MSTSTLQLFQECKIKPEKNFLVESIHVYLSTLTSKTITGFQFQRHQLSTTITIDTSTLGTTAAVVTSPFSDYFNYNYCSITNDEDEIPVYYFIVNKEWRAKDTVRLSLAMDTINTFRIGIDYSMGNKTEVIREHQDRIYNDYVTEGDYVYYKRRIDVNSEGITPVLYKKQENIVREGESDDDWFLLYLAHNAAAGEEELPVAVDTFIMSSNSVSVKTASGLGFELSLNLLLSDKIYYFGSRVTGTQSGKISIDGTLYDIGGVMVINKTSDNHLVVQRATGAIISGYCQFETVGIWEVTNDLHVLFYTLSPLLTVNGTDYVDISHGDYNTLGFRIVEKSIGSIVPEYSGTVQSIDPMSTVDRTDTRIMKLIMLPYCPFDITFDAGGNMIAPAYVVLGTVTWGESNVRQYLKIQSDYSGSFENNISVGDRDINVFQNLFTRINLFQDVRNDDNESKLYHSDFYNNRFVYDAFNYPIQLENISKERLDELTLSSPLDTTMVTSNGVNSNFLFDFKNIDDRFVTSDYEHLMMVSRNNEVPIYSSDYINYIRNGYNYDKTARNIGITQSAFGIVGSAIELGIGATGVGGIVGKYSTYLTEQERYNKGAYVWEKYKIEHSLDPKYRPQAPGNLGLESLYASGQITSGINGIASGITSIIQNEQSFEQKQKQMKMSSVSVSGSNDVDLMKYYSQNKAKICEYQVSDRMKEKLGDLFYYCGYDAGSIQKVPSLHSRKWFNYLQCNPDIIDTETNISQEYIDDLKSRWSIGVTILHNQNDTWDFNQEKANNERWLYN